ncbi:hypothetical protein ACVXG8_09710 [Escherichia coli]
MLIDAVLRHYLKNIDENAWRVVFAYYVCNSSEIRIASWQHAVSKPRVMKTRGGISISTEHIHHTPGGEGNT